LFDPDLSKKLYLSEKKYNPLIFKGLIKFTAVGSISAILDLNQ
jgi:hypothetical protein